MDRIDVVLIGSPWRAITVKLIGVETPDLEHQERLERNRMVGGGGT